MFEQVITDNSVIVDCNWNYYSSYKYHDNAVFLHQIKLAWIFLMNIKTAFCV